MYNDDSDEPLTGEQPEIYRQLNGLERQLDILDKGITVLIEKIGPILGPEEDATKTDGVYPQDTRPQSLMARQLEENADKLNRMSTHVAYITDRIEL